MFRILCRKSLAIGGILPPVALFLPVVMLLAASCERRDVGRRLDKPGPIVARVNGRPLYKRDFDGYLPSDYERALTAEERKAYFDRWIATQLLYEEAQESGVGVTADMELRLEQLKKNLVADQLVQKVIQERAIVSGKEVLAYYEAHHDEYVNEYRVSHILVSSLEDAEEVTQLLETRTFSWVARRHSLDKHTGIGGDLGFLSKGNMTPEFEEVVFDMEVGEVSNVIESDFGYHIIKLSAVRASRNKLDYEDAAEEISRLLLLEKRSAVYDSLISSLMARAEIEVIDPELRMTLSAAASGALDAHETIFPDSVAVQEQ
jgi:peptidyl-prolyl cis-trans isomerase C